MRLVQRMHKKSGENEVPLISDETETKLLGCLRNTLTNKSNILVISCVDPGQHLFEHCLPSLKFCASIKEQISKKLKKIKLMKEKKQ